jgi:signal transduction histidine kinase/PAS domain-containing protein
MPQRVRILQRRVEPHACEVISPHEIKALRVDARRSRLLGPTVALRALGRSLGSLIRSMLLLVAIDATTRLAGDFALADSGALDEAAHRILRAISESSGPDLLERPDDVALLPEAGSRLLTPIRRETQGFGALLLESGPDRSFDRQDLQAVSALASHAAVAFENARLFRQVETEREKSQQIVENMADALLTLDPERRVRSVNPAAERVLGQPVAGLVGRALCDLLDCGLGLCGPSCGAIETMLSGASLSASTWRVRSPDVPPTILRLSCSPLALPEQGVVVLAHDITRDEELAQFQRDVISTFSHELRAPLANISALADVVLDDASGEVALSRERLEMLRLQARRLANLSQRTLDVARLDAGAWQLESRPLPVNALARDAIRRWEGAAPGRTFTLAVPDGAVWAWGDEDAVSLLLDNLLENAVKYAPAGSPISVIVTSAPAGFVTLGVEDCGEPLPPGERMMLFQRFYRRESTTARTTYGYGLGLYIVRKLSQAMGGDAWVEPLDGQGNRFAFCVPAMEEHGQDPDR